MSQFVETPTKGFASGAALSAFRRVKLSSGVLQYAGAAEMGIGTIDEATFADTNYSSGYTNAAVRLWTAQGTRKMVAAGAIAAGADVWAAASGKVNDVASGTYVGKALEAATADGDVIEVLSVATTMDGAQKTVEAHTADDTLTVAESGSVHTTYGASGTVVFSLPAATVGLNYMFVVGAAQELRIDPNGTETISLPSTGVAGAAGKYLTANAAGESVYLVCASAGTWACMGFTGTWTAEA